jgi:hypothetical protein
MTTQQDKIYFGYFPDFATPTILFSGRPEAFGLLKNFFQETITREEKEIHLNDLSLFVGKNTNIVFSILPQSIGMKRINHNTYEWGLSRQMAVKFSEMLNDFAQAKSDSAFHQYFDCDSLDDVEVKVSVGEYDSGSFSE